MKPELTSIDNLVETLDERLGKAPDILIVLGSGLGAVADELDNRETVEVGKIPDWPSSTVEGHAGLLHKGSIGGSNILIQQGRIHLYEGYRAKEVVRPIRAAVTWGVKTVILTNAGGGVDQALVPGQLMIFTDHVNLTGANPLVGPNVDSRGQRFPDMTDLYDPGLRAQAIECAVDLGINLGQGVYAGVLGPSYETPAEIQMLSNLGVQAVGMSTVLEAIAARHLGARVVGISCITNAAAGLEGALLDHGDVQSLAGKAANDLTRLIVALTHAIGDRVQ